MKWHPLSIRFALSLKYASSSAYHMARNSGLIALPLDRTLRDYTHWTTVKDGIQEVVQQTMRNNLPCRWIKRKFKVDLCLRRTRFGEAFQLALKNGVYVLAD